MNKKVTTKFKKASSMPVPIAKPRVPKTKTVKEDQFNIPKSKTSTRPFSAL